MRVKTTVNEPEFLRPYLIHGIDLTYSERSKDATGECPFCNRERKFSIQISTGKYRCFVCTETGNASQFVKLLYSESLQETTDRDYKSLARQRGYRSHLTLKKWAPAKSMITGNWLIPGYNVQGELKTLYLWGDKLFPTPGIGHYLQGLQMINENDTIFITEGFWDGVALDEVVEGSIISLPGCSVFFDDWLTLFANRDIAILFDNDHPKRVKGTKKTKPSAGYENTKTISATLGDSPKSISYLMWGPEGYDKTLPHKMDLRDYLGGLHLPSGSSLRTSHNRSKAISRILGRITPVPQEWTLDRVRGLRSNGTDIPIVHCDNWKDLIEVWGFALEWTDGLEQALCVMLACCVSTQTVDDQLWIKIISPPSSGKSTLCEALSVSSKYVLARSVITGFHSGSGSNDEDRSLIAQAGGKTLITKDADTLMKSPHCSQIFSEARDIYDTVSRTQYRTGKAHNYTGKRMTWIIAGTKTIREIDSSELGERFLDCVIMEDIDDTIERKIGKTKASGVIGNIHRKPKDGDMNSNYSPEMVLAMGTTAGYLEYLRDNSDQLYTTLQKNLQRRPRETKRLESKLIDFATFVSYLRARPSMGPKDKGGGDREMNPRLTGQITKLALSVALVLNQSKLTQEVMQRTSKVASDTAKGITLDLVRTLYRSDVEVGLSEKELAKRSNHSINEVEMLISFLVGMKAVQSKTILRGRIQVKYYTLSDSLHNLYQSVEEYET